MIQLVRFFKRAKESPQRLKDSKAHEALFFVLLCVFVSLWQSLFRFVNTLFEQDAIPVTGS